MKVLWERRPVPDNYVGPLFLSQLKHNHNVVGYNPQTLAGDAGVLLISLAAAMNFVLTFAAIYSRGLDPRLPLAVSAAVCVVVMGKWLATHRHTVLVAAKSVVATVVGVMSLTPVFRSLTESTSSDSIWALTGWLLLVNVAVSTRRFPVLSVNSALAATIVLASRLSDSLSVFYFIMASILSFVTMPTVYRWLRINGRGWAPGLLTVISAQSWVLCWHVLGGVLLSLWLVLQAAVLFGLPRLFMALQKHKDRIAGPWDMARPVLD